MAKVRHLPKKEFPHNIFLWKFIDTKLEVDPKDVTNVKVERNAKMVIDNGNQTLVSQTILFVDSKWSKGADMLTDFTINSKVNFNNEEFTIEGVEYIEISGEKTHIEVFLT